MSDCFPISHAITAHWEGGWSDHPADPGGKTMYGVTEAVFHAWLKRQGAPVRPVRSITKAEALEIYRAEYWQPTAKRYNLVPGVDLATYDAAVNAGVSRAIGWLTKGADKANDHVKTIQNICRQRLSFKQGLAIWKTFGRGWLNRVTDVEAKSVAMAIAARADHLELQQRLEDEAAAAGKKANNQNAGGAASGGSTVAPVGVDNLDQVAGWILAGGLAAVVLLAAFLFWRAHINRKRQRAYEAEAAAI